jgi:hypothetical protein
VSLIHTKKKRSISAPHDLVFAVLRLDELARETSGEGNPFRAALADVGTKIPLLTGLRGSKRP